MASLKLLSIKAVYEHGLDKELKEDLPTIYNEFLFDTHIANFIYKYSKKDKLEPIISVIYEFINLSEHQINYQNILNMELNDNTPIQHKTVFILHGYLLLHLNYFYDYCNKNNIELDICDVNHAIAITLVNFITLLDFNVMNNPYQIYIRDNNLKNCLKNFINMILSLKNKEVTDVHEVAEFYSSFMYPKELPLVPQT